MNVTSLELSKELYELSGWGDTTSFWWWDKRFYTPGNTPVSDGFELSEYMHNQFIEDDKQEGYPAYDLGYLLRKLQERPRIELKQMSGRRWVASTKFGVLVDNPDTDVEVRDFDGVGDSPEDAAAKLAIELFKQGVLTRGDDE